MTENFIGRKEQIQQLDAIMASKESEFVVVYGRRRIGKTYLVNSYFDNTYAFKITGLAKKDKHDQLANFAESLKRYGDKKSGKPRTWLDAFNRLRDLLEAKSNNPTQKRVLFIDELPWMDTRNSNLITALEHFWNDWACVQQNVVLIACGSATSWITKNILNNKGGLHNRVTEKIYLHPFTLAECREYINSNGLLMDDKSIAECYMIMGGVPYYLKHLHRGKSLAQNVDNMFFRDKGSLSGEFDALYASLFDQSDNYIKVVEALSSKNKGLTRQELLEATSINAGGHFSTILKNLVDCDFVRYYKGYDKKSKSGLYQLIDPFTLFYFKFIKKYGTFDKPFWQYQVGTRTHDTWAGLAFEQLCLNHYKGIERKLGITGVITNLYSWTSSPDSDEKAQIDLVIKRSDKVINICEIKYYDGDYVTQKNDKESIERKVRSFKAGNNIRCAVHPVLVTTYGLKANAHSDIFQNTVTLEDLFLL